MRHHTVRTSITTLRLSIFKKKNALFSHVQLQFIKIFVIQVCTIPNIQTHVSTQYLCRTYPDNAIDALEKALLKELNVGPNESSQFELTSHFHGPNDFSHKQFKQVLYHWFQFEDI